MNQGTNNARSNHNWPKYGEKPTKTSKIRKESNSAKKIELQPNGLIIADQKEINRKPQFYFIKILQHLPSAVPQNRLVFHSWLMKNL